MKLICVLLALIAAVVLGSDVIESFALYKVKASSTTEKEVGEALIPYLFQNSIKLIKRRGFTGTLSGTDLTFIVGRSTYDATRDFFSQITIRQLIYVYRKADDQFGGILLPKYHVELNASYANTLTDFDERMKVGKEKHTFIMKKGTITVNAIKDDF